MASALSLPRLHRAAACGEAVKLKQFLTAGDRVNARASDGRTALLCAVRDDRTECVEILLAAGADPSMSDKGQFFPLYVAAQNKNIAIADALIKANADRNAIRPEGGTALCAAASTGVPMVQLLLDSGVDTSKTAAGGQHPLTTASLEGHVDVVTMLLDAGADAGAIGPGGVTALIAGAAQGFCDVVRILLKGGADVNQPTSPDGLTALHVAACKGFDEVINMLTAFGAAVYHADAGRRTSLHEAAFSGHPKCAEALLRAGANVSARDNKGASPLHLAAMKGFTDVIEVLLSGGAHADVNSEDDLRHTPLTLASSFADVRAVHLLLDAGADINKPNSNGCTALCTASSVKIVKALLDRGGDVKVATNSGATVLHTAGFRGSSAGVICALFKEGVDPTVKDQRGNTAADVARGHGHEDAAKLLDLLEAKHRAMNNTNPTEERKEDGERSYDR